MGTMKVVLILSTVLVSLIVTSPVENLEGGREGRMIRGNACEYIKVNSIPANQGCTDGSKFVIKRLDDNTRKQFLILGGEVILAFVQRAGRFSQCASYRDITSEVDCQTLSDLTDFDLMSATI